jgi:hypothetical protein
MAPRLRHSGPIHGSPRPEPFPFSFRRRLIITYFV